MSEALIAQGLAKSSPTELIANIQSLRAEVQRLRIERDELRYKVRAADLSDQQLADEMAEMQRTFSRRGEHGGSPGEWSYERMGEIATEQQRRTARTSTGGDHARD